MNLVLWLALGGLIGFVATWRLAWVERVRLLIDVALGALGALVAGMLALPATRWLSTSEVDVPALMAAAAGALVLLGLARLRARRDGDPRA